MRRIHNLLSKTTRLNEIDDEAILDSLALDDWREKAERLQARRWHRIRHQLA